MSKTISLSDVLKLVNGKLAHELQTNLLNEPRYAAIAPLNIAEAETISFLSNEKYLDEAKNTKAGLLLCSANAVPLLEGNTSSVLIVCENPYAAFAKVSQIFFTPTHSYKGISKDAMVDETAQIAQTATIFPNVFISPGAVVGERTVIYPGCFIGVGSIIGADCILYPNVVIREGCAIGERCILNPGVVIGGDGFGFAPTSTENVKIPHIGGVEIADDVEIGANAAIDRGTIESTQIGRQTKIDNLVTIGHNVQVGEFCFLAGQTGIAGSTKIGDRVITAGQVGVSGHLTVGNRVIIGPQSGVTKNIPAGETWLGSPARSHKEYARWLAILNRFVKDKEKNK